MSDELLAGCLERGVEERAHELLTRAHRLRSVELEDQIWAARGRF